ncbi:hypothetical protein BSLA_02f2775 [Burkholderia stabilis]|nr:hypothetical protein BSLA_02f2775 [Burkholderia stabilis]
MFLLPGVVVRWIHEACNARASTPDSTSALTLRAVLLCVFAGFPAGFVARDRLQRRSSVEKPRYVCVRTRITFDICAPILGSLNARMPPCANPDTSKDSTACEPSPSSSFSCPTKATCLPSTSASLACGRFSSSADS